jgi:flagellar hook-associated protein 2
MAVDYISALGAGASFNTKEIVSALIEAERAPQENQINRKLDRDEAEISALSDAKAAFSDLRSAALKLNDLSDFSEFSISNTQSTTFSASASSTATPGNHSVTISSIAKAQRTTGLNGAGNGFSSAVQFLNGGNSFDLTISIGASNPVSHTVSVTNTTPKGVAEAINAADLGISANVVDMGTSGTNYAIQLAGTTGAESAFSIAESVSDLSFSTPSGFNAADASLVVNGVNFTRSENAISDIIDGITLNLNSATTGAASLNVNADTSVAKQNILDFVTSYNTTKSKLDSLTSAEEDGALSGDSIIRQTIGDIRAKVIGSSSTPGTSLSTFSDLGVSITKSGTLEINETKLDSALLTSFSDATKILSADTNNQSEIGDASRGIAGDLAKLLADISSTTGYFTTRTDNLQRAVTTHNADLQDLDERMEAVKARYEKQFVAMQKIIEEMNNTRENLINSFENLPFTAKK